MKDKNKRHRNIPVFIPHLGCPHDCIFCNQRTISGSKKFDRSSVVSVIESVLETISDGDETEIAFFGGSFTGIDRGDMIYLLDTAQKYVDDGRVESIRLSTRPDYIDNEILDILAHYSVKTIELGIQSLSDEVLRVCERGHSAECAINACKMVKEANFLLVGQMMVGLPSSTAEDERATAEEICRLGADGARIYPTVVLNSTALHKMAKDVLSESKCVFLPNRFDGRLGEQHRFDRVEVEFYDNDNGFVKVAEYRNGELRTVGMRSPNWILDLQNFLKA